MPNRSRSRRAAPLALEVRAARAADARSIAGIHVRAWREAYRGLMPAAVLRGLSVARGERFWSRALREREAEVLVAASDGVVLGCVSVGASRDADAGPATAELWTVYVDPPAWRRGTGRAVWRAVVDHLRAQQCREVTLWVLADNLRAQRFYESLGFRVEAGQRKLFEQGGARLPEVRMRRALRGLRDRTS
jgi:ribosomal protein S18 acetylase RimI-like enzyme